MNILASRFSSPSASQKRRVRPSVVTRSVIARCRVVMLQSADDLQLVLDGLQRLQRRAQVKTAFSVCRKPMVLLNSIWNRHKGHAQWRAGFSRRRDRSATALRHQFASRQ